MLPSRTPSVPPLRASVLGCAASSRAEQARWLWRPPTEGRSSHQRIDFDIEVDADPALFNPCHLPGDRADPANRDDHRLSGYRDTVIISHQANRSEERRVGKESVSTVRSRWLPDH